jgi:glucose 1-dehydrogenase
MARVAVVTGSSKGWGRAVAEGLAGAGATVVVNGTSDQTEVVAGEIAARGGTALAVRLATDTEDGVDELMRRALEAFGHVDIWVNALGVQRPEPLLTLSLANWELILRVQLTAVFLGTRRAARQMVEQGSGGRIMNVVGGGAYGLPEASAHAASKGGALSATVSWAGELAPYGITVNGIRGGLQSPGMRELYVARGRMAAEVPFDDDAYRELGFYRREEAWPLAVWLASEPVGDVTGFHIGIDGTRIVAYERVGFAVELKEEGGWTVEALERRLHPALVALDATHLGTQRNLPGGGSATSD